MFDTYLLELHKSFSKMRVEVKYENRFDCRIGCKTFALILIRLNKLFDKRQKKKEFIFLMHLLLHWIFANEI